MGTGACSEYWFLTVNQIFDHRAALSSFNSTALTKTNDTPWNVCHSWIAVEQPDWTSGIFPIFSTPTA